MIDIVSNRYCLKVKELYMSGLDFFVKLVNIMRFYIVIIYNYSECKFIIKCVLVKKCFNLFYIRLFVYVRDWILFLINIEV